MNTAVKKLINEINSMTWLDNHGPVNPDWVVFDNCDAAYGASCDVACDAAYDAVYHAARAAYYATFDAVYYTTHYATFDAVYYTTYCAVYDAVYDAAIAAIAVGAARDAALLAGCLVTFADQPDNLHLAHARARWAVWQAGFGLIADVDGNLFVYRKV